MAAASSRLIPAARATGAIYFIVSPSMGMSVLAVVKTAVITSATRVISEASSPKPDRMFEAMSAVVARSTAPARARSSMAGIAAICSCAVKPALARKPIPAAA